MDWKITADEFRAERMSTGPYINLTNVKKAMDEWAIEVSDLHKRGEENGWRASEKRSFDAASAQFKKLQELKTEFEAEVRELEERERQRAPHEHIVRSIPGDYASGSKKQKETEEELRAFLAGEINNLEVNFKDLEVTRNEYGRLEVRDLTVGTTTAGGHTVPTSFHRDLYQHMIDASGVRQAGATVITTDSGEDRVFPKTTSHGTAAIVGEGTALAEADPAFNKVTLGSWKYGQLIEVTNELISDSGVDLLAYLAQDAGRAIGYATEDDYCNGTGTNEPVGIFPTMGTAVTGATGGTGVPSINNLIDTVYSIDPAYLPKAAWLMRPATAAYIRKLAVASTAPEGTWGQSLRDGQPATLLGYPVYLSRFAPAMGTPAKPIAFGDFSTYYIRDVKGVRFERSDDAKFSQDMVQFRAILRTDGDLVDLTGSLKAFAGPST